MISSDDRRSLLAHYASQDPETMSQDDSLAVLAAWYLEPGNYFHFCVDVLDRDLVTQPHEEMCSVAEHLIQTVRRYFVDAYQVPADEKLHYLCLSPRGTFKSTVWNQCIGVFLAIMFPNIRILIDSETVTKAEVFLGDIRSQFEGNPILIALYGNLVDKDKWNAGMATLSNRNRAGVRESTFMTCGVGKSMPGMHYDLIIGDDYVSDQNTGTADQIQKVIDHIARAKSLLDPGAPHFLLGTRWHFNDPYDHILRTQKDRYHLYIKSCGGQFDQSKAPLYFPTRLTEDTLKALRKEQGSFIFSCQYAMHPIPDGEQTFDCKQYNVISTKEFKELLNGIPYRWYYFVDPAITEESLRRGDYTAISPYVVFPDGRRFLYRAKAIRVGPNKLIDTIYNHFISVKRDLGPSYNGRAHIEAIAFQKLLLPSLKQKTEEHGERIKWVEMKTDSRTSKEVRIRAAVPFLEAGDLWIVQDTDKASPDINDLTDTNALLLLQAEQFPMATNDDLIDNQGFMVHLVKIPKGKETPQKQLGWDCRMGVEDTTPITDKLRKIFATKDFEPTDEDLGFGKNDKWTYDL